MHTKLEFLYTECFCALYVLGDIYFKIASTSTQIFDCVKVFLQKTTEAEKQ